MRTLAIDLGDKRVGLALSDESGRLATPYDVLQVTSPQALLDQLQQIIDAEGVQRLVVGLPLNMDGTAGPAAKRTMQWASHFTRLPVVFVDERLSSFAAEQSINDRRRAGEKLTRKRKKEQLDAIAASGFLQDFLDGRLAPMNP